MARLEYSGFPYGAALGGGLRRGERHFPNLASMDITGANAPSRFDWMDPHDLEYLRTFLRKPRTWRRQQPDLDPVAAIQLYGGDQAAALFADIVRLGVFDERSAVTTQSRNLDRIKEEEALGLSPVELRWMGGIFVIF